VSSDTVLHTPSNTLPEKPDLQRRYYVLSQSCGLSFMIGHPIELCQFSKFCAGAILLRSNENSRRVSSGEDPITKDQVVRKH
jgi:hypothetical protein